MRDHQQFEKTVLPNGIILYAYQGPFRTANLEILLPAGSAHSHVGNGYLPGSAHFLEHVQLIRSSRFPTPYQVDYEIGMLGGHGDGTTHPRWTSHWIDVPAHHADFAAEALTDRVFHPLFHEDDFDTERTVVMNERNQRTFYPGTSPTSQHYYSQFLNDMPYTLDQLFGSDADLEKMSVGRIADMHKEITAQPGIIALSVGPDDGKRLATLLGELPTVPRPLEERITPTTWANRSYASAYFTTVSQPTLKVAWLHPRLPQAEAEGISFIISLLINTTHGALYREFREERGWVYGIDGFCSQREQETLFGLTFPVNEAPQVEFIRSCLLERIQAAVRDQKSVENEIVRCLNNRVYQYQTADEIIASASRSLMTYDRIYTEKEWVESLRQMADPPWRESLLERFFRPESMGEVRYMPERRKLVAEREVIASSPRRSGR